MASSEPYIDHARLLSALRRSEERFRSLTMALNRVVWTTDAAGEVVEDSPSWRAFTGQRFEDYRGRGWLNAVHPDDRQTAQAAWQDAVATQAPYAVEYRLRRADGTYLWTLARGTPVVDETGQIREWVGANSDISQRRRRDQELRTAEERTRLALEAANLGTFDVDHLSRELRWDARCKELHGVSSTVDLIGEAAFYATVHPEDRARVREVLDHARDPQSSGDFSIAFRTVGPDDRFERWLWGRGRVFFDDRHQPLRSIGTVLDITDRKRAEAEREARVEELQRSLHVSELFAGILGHDLRNPLNAISIGAQLLGRKLRADPELSKSADRITHSAERMGRMIEQLLDFTRARLGGGIPVAPAPCDLARVCAQLVDELQAAHPERRIEVKTRGKTSGRFDGDRLAQVISNLVGNAIQHSLSEAPIRVLLDGEAPEQVRLCVENAGTIPPEVMPILFAPFRGTEHRPTRGGSLGLGLYITQQIVLAHGGRIHVESERGLTAFHVRLPRATATSV